MEIYRVTKDSPKWQRVSYDYVRIDAFVAGQSIPVEVEFTEDDDEKLQAVLLVEDHKPVAGLRIEYHDGFAQIGRVCTVREKQRHGYGALLLKEAEKWILENGVHRVLITSQDRSVGFYLACGYTQLSEEDYEHYFPEEAARHREREDQEEEQTLGFSILLVGKDLA